MTYDQLMDIAKTVLLSVDAASESLPAPLVYVLETSGNQIHTVINDDFQPILNALVQTNDTLVKKVLAMWKDFRIDVPSYAFRKALLKLNIANAQAGIPLMTESGYNISAIETLM